MTVAALRVRGARGGRGGREISSRSAGVAQVTMICFAGLRGGRERGVRKSKFGREMRRG